MYAFYCNFYWFFLNASSNIFLNHISISKVTWICFLVKKLKLVILWNKEIMLSVNVDKKFDWRKYTSPSSLSPAALTSHKSISCPQLLTFNDPSCFEQNSTVQSRGAVGPAASNDASSSFSWPSPHATTPPFHLRRQKRRTQLQDLAGLDWKSGGNMSHTSKTWGGRGLIFPGIFSNLNGYKGDQGPPLPPPRSNLPLKAMTANSSPPSHFHLPSLGRCIRGKSFSPPADSKAFKM